MAQLSISNSEIRASLNVQDVSFDLYVAPLINMANTFSQATRPRYIGQMTELVSESNAQSVDEWREFYLSERPDAVDEAIERITQKIKQLREALDAINESTIREWVEDLLIAKTFVGLKVQDVVLAKVANAVGADWRKSTPEEESQGIDGFIADVAVSVKPTTYKQQSQLPEGIDATIIYYEKKKDRVVIKYDESILHQ